MAVIKMTAIVNVDDAVTDKGPHVYELRINKRAVARFIHNREEPLHECLLRAAIAAEEKAKSKNGMVRPFLEPLYDDVYYKGVEWLNSL